MRIKNLFFTTFIIATSIFSTRTEAQETASLSQIRWPESTTIYQDSIKNLKSSMDFEKYCENSRKLKKSGIILLSIGIVSMPIGAGIFAVGVLDARNSKNFSSGINIAILGIAFLYSGIMEIIVGAPIYFVGNYRIKRNDCNGKPNLKLGSSSHGVGLQLTF